jgi:hypothetical protein
LYFQKPTLAILGQILNEDISGFAQQNYITIINNSSFHELKGFKILNLINIFGIKSFIVFQSAFEIVMFVWEDKNKYFKFEKGVRFCITSNNSTQIILCVSKRLSWSSSVACLSPGFLPKS